MWSILEEGRGYEGFNERGGRELEMAYKEGCEHGYKKGYEAAMREMQGGDMGFRGNNGGSYGGRELWRRFFQWNEQPLCSRLSSFVL